MDIGLFSDNPAMPDFYTDRLGLTFVEALVHSETYEEQFYAVHNSSLKINYSREPMLPGHGGYRGLVIADADVTEPRELTDPDGLPIRLVPPGHEGVTEVGVVCAVRDLGAQRRFLTTGLGAITDDDGLRLGRTRLELVEEGGDRSIEPTWRRGFGYIVVFVDDTPAAHESLLAAGGEHGVRPVRLADRVVFSWLRDPGGNWIELVQPAEPDRPLPDVAPIEDHWAEIVRWRENAVPF